MLFVVFNHDRTMYFLGIKRFFPVELSKINEELKSFYHF